MSHPERKIQIDTTHGDVDIADTLIHEMFHCIFYMHEIEGGNLEQEEKLAARLTNGLCMLMADNPELFAEIVTALDPRPEPVTYVPVTLDYGATGAHDPVRLRDSDPDDAEPFV